MYTGSYSSFFNNLMRFNGIAGKSERKNAAKYLDLNDNSCRVSDYQDDRPQIADQADRLAGLECECFDFALGTLHWRRYPIARNWVATGKCADDLASSFSSRRANGPCVSARVV